MELSRNCCRLCLTECEFNVPLFGSFCRKTNMLDKILICLKLVVEETDYCNTVCYKCAENVERYYSFIAHVKKSQAKLLKDNYEPRQIINDTQSHAHVNGARRVTSYVREQLYDADYTFSFLEVPNEEKKEVKTSSPFFSYFSPPNVLIKPSPKAGSSWRSPVANTPKNAPKHDDKYSKRHCKTSGRPRHHSRDLFESQSQDVEEEKSLDWKLTPDDNIINRVREKCFGRSDF